MDELASKVSDNGDNGEPKSEESTEPEQSNEEPAKNTEGSGAEGTADPTEQKRYFMGMAEKAYDMMFVDKSGGTETTDSSGGGIGSVFGDFGREIAESLESADKGTANEPTNGKDVFSGLSGLAKNLFGDKRAKTE